MATKAHLEGNKKYLQTLDEIKVRVPKGAKACIKVHADEHDGGSVNGFINRAIIETMERDTEKEEAAERDNGE